MAAQIKFKNQQDWNEFITANGKSLTGIDLAKFRQNCYSQISELRKRPLIVYCSKFPAQRGIPNSIELSDVDGFTDLINSVPADKKEIDVLLHSPGGTPDATERIVYILRNRFEKVGFLVPHSAYSAATMLAMSGNDIVLHPSATLGPIDPQINGVPARSIKRGFEKARDAIKESGPEVLPAYIPMIQKYSLDQLELCEDSEKLSKELVTNWLTDYMFKGESGKEETIKNAVDYLSRYEDHLIHSRPLVIQKLEKFGLKIKTADDGLKELMWEAYLMINGFFNMTQFVKLFENQEGISWGRQFAQFTLQGQPGPITIPMPNPSEVVEGNSFL